MRIARIITAHVGKGIAVTKAGNGIDVSVGIITLQVAVL